MSDELRPCPKCCGEMGVVRCSDEDGNPRHIIKCSECGLFGVKYSAVEAIDEWNSLHEIKPLQWTKTPPTEKDLGKVFVAKRRRNDGTEELFTGRLQISKSFDRILRLNASSHCGVQRTERVEFLVIDGYEFLGPLPE